MPDSPNPRSVAIPGGVVQCRFSPYSGDKGCIEGYGSVFGYIPDSHHQPVRRGAFAKTLAVHAARQAAPSMLWAHDEKEVIGVWTDLKEDDYGLRVCGKLNLETRRGSEARALLLDGACALSIGYFVEDEMWDPAIKASVLTEGELVEVSVVHVPANPGARVLSVASIVPGTIRDFESGLRDAFGFSRREARRLASGGWPAFTGRDAHDLEALQTLTCEQKSRTEELKRFLKGLKHE